MRVGTPRVRLGELGVMVLPARSGRRPLWLQNTDIVSVMLVRRQARRDVELIVGSAGGRAVTVTFPLCHETELIALWTELSRRLNSGRGSAVSPIVHDGGLRGDDLRCRVTEPDSAAGRWRREPGRGSI